MGDHETDQQSEGWTSYRHRGGHTDIHIIVIDTDNSLVKKVNAKLTLFCFDNRLRCECLISSYDMY